MKELPIFLSLVVVVRDQSALLGELLESIVARVSDLVDEFEIVVVDNGSTDDSVALLKTLAGEGGLPNLQVFALTKEVDADTAAWAGLEGALGDFVAVIDPLTDDIDYLPKMLDAAVGGADVVFARNLHVAKQSLPHRLAFAAFNRLYAYFNGVNLASEAPRYRVLSRRVANFILQHPQPAITYRHLPATGGFSRANLEYRAPPRLERTRRLRDDFERGMRLLVSTTRAPMRIVTALSLFGAVANLLYSFYVVAVALLKSDVAPGWVSLSLQQSGMFFLISLVLLVLGEYILHMARLSGEGPAYHVAQEFTSVRLTRREKLNVEQAAHPAAIFGS